MKVVRVNNVDALVSMTINELVLLANCINEALELGSEFPIRVGIESHKAKEIMAILHGVIDELDKRSSD